MARSKPKKRPVRKPIVARVTLTRVSDRADWYDGDNLVMCGRWVTDLFPHDTTAEDMELTAAVSTSLRALGGDGPHAEIRFVPSPANPADREGLRVLLNGKGSLTCPGWRIYSTGEYVPAREFLHERGDPIPVMTDFLPLLRRVTRSPRATKFYVRIVSSGAL